MSGKERSSSTSIVIDPSVLLIPVKAQLRKHVPDDAPPGSIYRDNNTVLIVGGAYNADGLHIQAEGTFYVDGLSRAWDGRWLGEADKLAWTEPLTGYPCIMLRAREGGFLSGFVGVPPSHSLYGVAFDEATRRERIEVHGGLTYSGRCSDGPTSVRRIAQEAHRICHALPRARVGEVVRVDGAHEQAWWFGFDCNHKDDIVPNEPADAASARFRSHNAVYRTDGFVCREIVRLAQQLAVIG